MENTSELQRIVGEYSAQLTRAMSDVPDEQVKYALAQAADEAFKQLTTGPRGEALAAMALNAVVDLCFVLPSRIVPEEVKGRIMLVVDGLFEETRVAMMGWQGQYGKKCNATQDACSVIDEDYKCYQRKVNNQWFCSSIRR